MITNNELEQAKEDAAALNQLLAGLGENPEQMNELRTGASMLPKDTRWKLISALMNDQERGDLIGVIDTFRRQGKVGNLLSAEAESTLDTYLSYLRL